MNRTMAYRVSAFAALAVLGLLHGCSGSSDRTSTQEPAPLPPEGPAQSPAQAEPATSVAIANPASENCIKQGGRLSIEKTPKGDEYGLCAFEDNHQCEEWALLRGECRAGGVRITGYLTPAGRFCAITGGTYTVTSGNDAATERGTCKLPNGKECEAAAYFSGDCTRSP
jgi:putative hemolysin